MKIVQIVLACIIFSGCSTTYFNDSIEIEGGRLVVGGAKIGDGVQPKIWLYQNGSYKDVIIKEE